MTPADLWFIRHRAEHEFSHAEAWFRQMLANPRAGQRLRWAADDLVSKAAALRRLGMHPGGELLVKAVAILAHPPEPARRPWRLG